jgi:hypothetical protein
MIGLASIALACSPRMGGWGWRTQQPSCVLASIEALGQLNHIYSNRIVGWLLYRFHPQVKVGIHWEYVAGPVRVREHSVAWRDGSAGLHAYFERYQVEAVVLNTSASGIIPGLEAWGWVLAHVDDWYVVMVPQARAWGMPVYDIIRPWGSTSVITPANAGHALEEAERALERCLGSGNFASATFAWAFKAQALQLLGRHREAFEAGLTIPEWLDLW